MLPRVAGGAEFLPRRYSRRKEWRPSPPRRIHRSVLWGSRLTWIELLPSAGVKVSNAGSLANLAKTVALPYTPKGHAPTTEDVSLLAGVDARITEQRRGGGDRRPDRRRRARRLKREAGVL